MQYFIEKNKERKQKIYVIDLYFLKNENKQNVTMHKIKAEKRCFQPFVKLFLNSS